jgi:DNA modification methylase
MKSILGEIGYADAIKVVETPKGLMIIDGHLRKEVSAETEVPILVLDLTPAEQDLMLATFDPIGSMATTDDDLLKDLLDSIDSDNKDINDLIVDIAQDNDVIVGISSGEQSKDPVPRVDKAAELQDTWKTESGQVWEIGSESCNGSHRIICGDCRVDADVDLLMAGKKAGMTFTDPPYNVNYGSDTNHPSWNNTPGRTIENDKMSSKDFAEFIRQSFQSVKRVCDGVIYSFGAQGADGRIMFTVLDNMFHNSGTIIWVKDRMVLGRGKYHTKYEPCWFGWNKSGSTFTSDRTLTNVWECKRPSVSEMHPTIKPVELIEMGIRHNPKAKSVLDPFIGSGSTMVACENNSRICYGMEIDPKYVAVTLQRMADMGLTPVLTNGK